MSLTGNQQADVPSLSGLTEEEKYKLISVLQRAQEFEDEESRLMRRPLEGQLTKFTNVVKGWLPRWFILDPETGLLEYFEKEEHRKLRPRGSLYLAGAVVCPSDEDSQTFSVHASNGEMIRMRASRECTEEFIGRKRLQRYFIDMLEGDMRAVGASEEEAESRGGRRQLIHSGQDAKERQQWVDRLRATAEHHTASLSKTGASNGCGDMQQPQPPVTDHAIIHTNRNEQNAGAVNTRQPGHVKFRNHYTHLPESLKLVKEHQLIAEDLCSTLHNQINNLASGGTLARYDRDLLMLKATSAAALKCVGHCFTTLHQQHLATHQPSSGAVRWFDPKPPALPESVPSSSNEDLSTLHTDQSCAADIDRVNHDDEVSDAECYRDTELGSVDEQKTVILNLLSQLKLGMDLTKVVLPTFILEKRSLLEMFADCMAHPHLFLRIANCATPEARMMAVVRWYLSSFNAGRQGSIAKKPYNPLLGEVFRCSWKISRTQLQCEDATSDGGDGSQMFRDDSRPSLQLVYCAEQVSHHPPISAFYCECPEQQMSLTSEIWTKSKFTGMSIGVEMIGSLTLRLLRLDEVYHISLPSVFARSILTVPWVELGEKLTLVCPQTGYSAAVTFHTKPFYGGRLHRVTADVKNGTSNVCKVHGEWDSMFEFTYSDGRKETMDVTKLAAFKKRVRPLNLQKVYESRKLWQNVTSALIEGNTSEATKHKHLLEERQRKEEQKRKEFNTPFPNKFFHKVDGSWIFKSALKKDQTNSNI